MGLTRLVSEVLDAPGTDGRNRLPQGWSELALAVLGDDAKVDLVRRLSGRKTISDAALRAAAKRMGIKLEWPWGEEALAEFTTSDASQLGTWRNDCLGDGPRRGRVALVDSTMLCGARDLISGGAATPITVLDLASLLNTLCVYDNVCFLENPDIALADLEEPFGSDIFIELPVQSTAAGTSHSDLGDVRAALRSLYKARTVPWLNDLRVGRYGTQKQTDTWVEAWETILSRPCDATWLLRDPDEGGTTAYPDVWNSPTELLLRDVAASDHVALASADGLATSPRRRSGEQARAEKREIFAQTSNARALFNANVAEILGVRYAASTVRLPILGFVADSTRNEIAQLLRVPAAQAALQNAYGQQVDTYAQAAADFLRIPYFAAYIFQSAGCPSDIPDVLWDARRKSAKFRARLFELNEQIMKGDSKATADLKAAITREHDFLDWKSKGFLQLLSTAGALTLSWGSPTMHGLNIVVALLSAVLALDTYRPILGRTRMRYELLGSMNPIGNSAQAVSALWPISDMEAWVRRARSLTSLQGIASIH